MTLAQFLSLLITLGPQFAAVWRVIVQLVNEYSGGDSVPRQTLTVSADEHKRLAHLENLSANHGGLAAMAFSPTGVLQVFLFIQQHPELLAAIQAIIAAFVKPAPKPAPEPAPPAAI